MTYPYNNQPAGLRIPPSFGLSDVLEAEFRELAWSWILVGQTDSEEFVDFFLDDQHDYPSTAEQTAAAFEFLVEVRREQQAYWTDEETTPPLMGAFSALAEVGVLARAGFTCCGTCGNAEIGDERDDSRVWRGYVFYHSQDAESMIEERSTYVGYGAFLGAHISEDEWNALDGAGQDDFYERITLDLMNQEVIPLLQRHGVEVEWDGNFATRILLNNVDHYVRM
jgi:hypothetical protein